jgi:ketosteroid isomerase-like protein
MLRSDEAIMSNENEALVRRAVEAYRRGDTAGLLELVHPDLEWTYLNPEDPDPQPQVCHGRHQLAWGLGHQAGQGLATDVEEIISSGDNVLVVGRTPGADQHRAWRNGDRTILVLRVSDGQIVAMRAFRDREQARRFAGLDD